MEVAELLDELGLQTQMAVDLVDQKLLRIVARLQSRFQLRNELHFQLFIERLDGAQTGFLVGNAGEQLDGAH